MTTNRTVPESEKAQPKSGQFLAAPHERDAAKGSTMGRGRPCSCTRETQVITYPGGDRITTNPIVKHDPGCLAHGKGKVVDDANPSVRDSLISEQA